MTALFTILIVAAAIVIAVRAVCWQSTSRLGSEQPRLGALRAVGVAPAAGLDERDEFFEIGNELFFDTARSPDGRYLVGATERHTDERGRKRKGACALKDISTGAVCFKEAVTRANNPHVSNDGLVIVEDWKDQSLSGALIGFSATGEQLWAKHFKANIYTSGLSADGRRAFVSTCGSDHELHSAKTFLLDATTGELVWVRDGWRNVRFDSDVLVAELEDTNGAKMLFPFDDTGELSPAYQEAAAGIREERERGKYWWVLPKVPAALKGSDPDIPAAKALLAGLDGKESEIPERSRAKLLRFRGEIAEAEGDGATALKLWEQALAIDPKVGIKRRYDSLAKALA